MKLNVKSVFLLMLGIFGFFLLVWTASAWTPKAVNEDQLEFLPGSQPHDAGTFESPDECAYCHGGYDENVEHDYNWRGSMMAQAARDPLWLASMAVTEQDSIWAVGNPNAGDICIRCHSPTGWLEGRSDPVNMVDLRGDDYWGVQCDFCHRMIDPFSALMQPDVPEDTDIDAKSAAQETYERDISVLFQMKMFNGTNIFSNLTNLPIYYGSGSLPDYIEAGGGQFYIDPMNNKRGPYSDTSALHGVYYSRFHSSKYFCQSCHDVSNPILASVLEDLDVPETKAAASYIHVERTASEFLVSAYGQGGSKTNIPGVDFADKCQDCHMKDVKGKGSSLGGVPERDDLGRHDFSGGNQWVLGMLASVDKEHQNYDSYNYEILSGEKYAGAAVDVDGIQGYGEQLLSGAEKSVKQLESAAELTIVSEDSESLTIRVQNNGGHKLISGFPEGRRMFLTVQFFDSAGSIISEINPYEPLVTQKDGNGNDVYVSGGTLTKTDEELVWECQMSSSLTGETKSFHMALADDRYKDNRIPPKGFDTVAMYDRLVQPRWKGSDAADYFTVEEYAGGYDDVTITKPPGTDKWYASLNYQTTSKEYIEFLKDEINGDAATLSSPTPSGEQNAYIVQTDPFFSTLKGWGDAMYDLWLHNGGSAPVLMEELGEKPVPEPCVIDTPLNLNAEAGENSINLKWDPVTDAEGYNIYSYTDGIYTLLDSTTDFELDVTGLDPDSEYCYAVTAYKSCPDETIVESGYSSEACAETEGIEYVLLLGPVLDVNEEPVENALMEITIDNVVYSGSTDNFGIAEITLDIEPPDGAYTVKVSKKNYNDVEFQIKIGADAVPESIPPLTKKEEQQNTETLVLFGIILTVIIIVMMMAMMMRKPGSDVPEKKNEKRSDPEENTDKNEND